MPRRYQEIKKDVKHEGDDYTDRDCCNQNSN